MHLATLRVEVRIGGRLRSKRQTVRAILDKIHRHFNVSVAEVDGEPPVGELLGFAAVATSRRDAREVLDRVADAVAAHPRAEVLQVDWTDH